MNPFCVALDFWNSISALCHGEAKVLNLTMESPWSSLPELQAFMLPLISLRSTHDAPTTKREKGFLCVLNKDPL